MHGVGRDGFVVTVEVCVGGVEVAYVPRRHCVGQVGHGQRNTGTVVDPVAHRGVVAPGGGQVSLAFRQVVLVPVLVPEVLVRGDLAQARCVQHGVPVVE